MKEYKLYRESRDGDLKYLGTTYAWNGHTALAKWAESTEIPLKGNHVAIAKWSIYRGHWVDITRSN